MLLELPAIVGIDRADPPRREVILGGLDGLRGPSDGTWLRGLAEGRAKDHQTLGAIASVETLIGHRLRGEGRRLFVQDQFLCALVYVGRSEMFTEP